MKFLFVYKRHKIASQNISLRTTLRVELVVEIRGWHVYGYVKQLESVHACLKVKQ